jgi:hypothetical protein
MGVYSAIETARRRAIGVFDAIRQTLKQFAARRNVHAIDNQPKGVSIYRCIDAAQM